MAAKRDEQPVGTFRALTFLTTRNEDPAFRPMQGLSTGSSVSHIACSLTFNPDAISEDEKKRLENLNTISGKEIFKKTTDENNRPVYELYFSFWPAGEGWSTNSPGSRLEDSRFDQQQSETYSPTQWNSKFADLADTNTVRSPIPFFGKLLPATEIQLQPSIMFHITRFKNEHEEKHPGSTEIAIQYAQKYEAWRDACLSKDSAKIEASAKALADSQLKLKESLFPGQDVTTEDFYKALDNSFTFGLPARDSATLPIFANADDKNGLSLNAMLDKIATIAENPKDHAYNVASNNCDHMVQSIIDAGAKNSAPHFRSALDRPLINKMGFPMFPGVTLNSVIKAERLAENQNDGRTENTFKDRLASLEKYFHAQAQELQGKQGPVGMPINWYPSPESPSLAQHTKGPAHNENSPANPAPAATRPGVSGP